MKLMIVDDEKQICSGLAETINWNEYGINTVLTAENGFSAIEMLNKCTVDIFIIDISMPGMDGLELASKVKEICSEARIILLTGYSEFEYAKKAIKIGVDEYFLKPVRVVELLTLVSKLVNRIKEEDEKNAIVDKYNMEVQNRKNEPHLLKEGAYLTDSQWKTESVGESYADEKKSNWLIEKCKKYIIQNYNYEISLEDLSKYVDRNASYVSHLFKQETGKSFSEFLNSIRIKKAVELISCSSMSVGEVATSVGFSNHRYFTYVFKKITGRNPFEFKKYQKI